jgi:nicotinamide-nucleotide amidase
MKASIVIIGDEILLGKVTDTNSGYIARALDRFGFEIGRISTIGDNGADIKAAVETSLSVADVVITTGGLGPTKDDITKQVMCQIFGGTLVRDDSVTRNIEQVFAKRRLNMNALTLDQALVPTSCRVIQNTLGTAPIMWFERNGKVLVAMPGVPFETEGMFDAAVAPQLQAHFNPDKFIAHRTAIVTGITESALAEKLDAWEREMPQGYHLAYLPDSPIIKLRLDGIANSQSEVDTNADRLFAQLTDTLSDLVISIGEKSVAQILIDALAERHYMLGSAESCTGGNIAHSITSVAGSSEVFSGTVVSYSNEIKHNVLGVSNDTLAQFGAVSEQTVAQMLDGACRVLGTDCAVATSGIAGPGGGTPDKPVGTVWIGAKSPTGMVVTEYHFPGNRERVINRATATAMLMLIKLLKEK